MSTPRLSANTPVAIVGGGPAGLMAAEALTQAGHAVDLYEAMPSVGRKFLMAGKGGMNITHSEPLESFLDRYGSRRAALEPAIRAFGPDEIRGWMNGLGIDSFVGSSGRVFPAAFKAAPLLRAWLRRLRAAGLRVHVRHRWTGWTADGALIFDTPAGPVTHRPRATILALGGGSWSRLGSDGAWVPILTDKGIDVAPLQASNCGFDILWSDHLRDRFAGHPVKPVRLTFENTSRTGEMMITASGIEGSVVYALSAPLRDAIATNGSATLSVDLAPDRTRDALAEALARPRGSRSLADHLRRTVGISGVQAALLREVLPVEALNDTAHLAAAIKALPLVLTAPRPLEEAISTAGGVRFEALDTTGSAPARPAVFYAGEMLDWEAPTGGYLLTACLALGRAAGQAAAVSLGRPD